MRRIHCPIRKVRRSGPTDVVWKPALFLAIYGNCNILQHANYLNNPLFPPSLTLSLIAIEQEKEKNQFIAGIENFDSKKLKHTETNEKNVLPTKEVIEAEKKA